MKEKAGLYIHIPFCKNKCPYCDFFSVKYNKTYAEKYVDKVIEQMKNYNGEFDTVYFGGGTPSILEPELIGKLLNAANNHFDIDNNSEITIECNPSKDLKNDFKLYKAYGINRISIGMQSAVDKERFALGRSAGKAQIEKAVNDAKSAGIDNISLDLMIGTPKQTVNSIDETFDFIQKMNIQHISTYMLKIEPKTKFFEIKDKLILPDEDSVSDMYLKTVKVLSELGFNQYEISNFAKTGYESRHNLKYWKLIPYLGLGISAHSFWNNRRFYCNSDFEIIDDGSGGDTNEKIMLGLRLSQGIEKSILNKDYKKFIKIGLIKENDTNIFLTPEGMLLSNIIINELI